jgi:N-acetylneuraminic acid mutarotase
MKLRALRCALLFTTLFGISFLLRASLPSVATGTWVAAGNMSAARSGACTVALNDGRLLISGGADANGPTATADLFNTNGSWSAAASMNSPRSHQSCAVLQDGRVLVAGGTTSGGGFTNSAEIYDPSADSWSQVGLIDARSGATASILQDGRVLVAGGQNSGGAVNTLEIFDPNTGNFSSGGTMSSPRQDHAAAF